jgi:hypothetical protein
MRIPTVESIGTKYKEQSDGLRPRMSEGVAASTIQRYWRGYEARKEYKMGKMNMWVGLWEMWSAVDGMLIVLSGHEARWDDAIKQTEDISYASHQMDNKNDVKSR